MKQYTCKTCEAELYWDSKTNKLKCEYCDSTFDPPEFDEDVDIEQKAEKADVHDKADDDSFGIDLVKYKCTECGAELVTAAGTVATINARSKRSHPSKSPATHASFTSPPPRPSFLKIFSKQ